MNKIILASKSEVRKKILLENGISCNVEPSKVDEDVIKFLWRMIENARSEKIDYKKNIVSNISESYLLNDENNILLSPRL